jgi:hypothetical protein
MAVYLKSLVYMAGFSGLGYVLLQMTTPDESLAKQVIFSIIVAANPVT